jgi:biopolymer transport protein ExbD
MNSGKGNRLTGEINVTPMIDVLLVLLIIFMVIVPAVPRGELAIAPQASHKGIPAPDFPIVLEILKGGNNAVSFRINQHEVARQDLPARLTEIYANRADRVLFLKGDDGLSFTQVAEVIDIGHSAGIDRIGLLTPKVQAGL